jgi:CheY-like chemotaxis protein
MRRRDFIGLLGGAVASRPLPTFAQTSSKRPLIAAQVGGSKTGADRYFSGFSQGMRELGYVEGHDYGFEVRYAEGNASRIPLLIEELVGLKPDIIVSGTMAGVIAAKKLTEFPPFPLRTAGLPIQQADLILMDIQLPTMDGYTARRQIKADPAMRSIPIIAVTSYALSGEEKKARAAGCDIVPKPFSPRQLLAKIRQYLP